MLAFCNDIAVVHKNFRKLEQYKVQKLRIIITLIDKTLDDDGAEAPYKLLALDDK